MRFVGLKGNHSECKPEGETYEKSNERNTDSFDAFRMHGIGGGNYCEACERMESRIPENQ